MVVVLAEDNVLVGLEPDKVDVALGLEAKVEVVPKVLLGAVAPNDEDAAVAVVVRNGLVPNDVLFKLEPVVKVEPAAVFKVELD